MSFEEEARVSVGAGEESPEANGPTRRKKRTKSLGDGSMELTGDSAAERLDEVFPFETRLLGKYWIAAILLQAALYSACFAGATMTLGVDAGSWAGAGSKDPGGGIQQSPFESFMYFTVILLLLYQIREIPPHVRAASEDELSYVKSTSLQEKMKAVKRMKWHQTFCFVPQPLMAIDALVGSMGAGILVFRYAAMQTGCAAGITEGLAQLDAVGVALLLVMALCVALIIALLFIVTRIHFAHFKLIQDCDAVQEYLQDTRDVVSTPRGTFKGAANTSLLKWYSLCILLQVVLLGMLSIAKDSVATEGKDGSAGMAKTLYVLMGVGIFYLGQQTGHINDYVTCVGHCRPRFHRKRLRSLPNADAPLQHLQALAQT